MDRSSHYRVCPKSTVSKWLSRPECVSTVPIWNKDRTKALLRFREPVSDSLTLEQAKEVTSDVAWRGKSDI